MLFSQIQTPMSIREYFNKDFYFLSQYILEFKDALGVSLQDKLDLYFRKNHIASFTLWSSEECMRLYKIIFHPEFTMVPEEIFQHAVQVTDTVFPDFRMEPNADYSVVVGPELLHLWVHKLVWEAVDVIEYKTLH